MNDGKDDEVVGVARSVAYTFVYGIGSQAWEGAFQAATPNVSFVVELQLEIYTVFSKQEKLSTESCYLEVSPWSHFGPASSCAFS